MYYGVDGKQKKESDSTYAKCENDNYFIRFCTYGSNIGKMLNPWNMFYQNGDDTKFNTEKGCRLYEYKKVDKNTFDLYVDFLNTRNQRQVLAAERAYNIG